MREILAQEAVGVGEVAGKIAIRESQSNLRINRALSGAVLACLREGAKEQADIYAGSFKRFLGAVNAPPIVAEGVDSTRPPAG